MNHALPVGFCDAVMVWLSFIPFLPFSELEDKCTLASLKYLLRKSQCNCEFLCWAVESPSQTEVDPESQISLK